MSEWTDTKRYVVYGYGMNTEMCLGPNNNNKIMDRLSVLAQLATLSDMKFEDLHMRTQQFYGDKALAVLERELRRISPSWDDLLMHLEESAQEKKSDILDSVDFFKEKLEALLEAKETEDSMIKDIAMGFKEQKRASLLQETIGFLERRIALYTETLEEIRKRAQEDLKVRRDL